MFWDFEDDSDYLDSMVDLGVEETEAEYVLEDMESL